MTRLSYYEYKHVFDSIVKYHMRNNPWSLDLLALQEDLMYLREVQQATTTKE